MEPRSMPLLSAEGVSKYFGPVVALTDVTVEVRAGEVVCLLGDNGAGKSTLIKILSGVFRPDTGSLMIDGAPCVLESPRDAISRGISTVYQDLSVLPLMSVSRNFFLGSEITKGRGILRRLDEQRASTITRERVRDVGIELRHTSQLAGTLSGGERQTLAIARAEFFGARVLILDEPTASLGVKEAAIVLLHVARARSRGLGVLLITHNIMHAYSVGNWFTILNRGRVTGTFSKEEMTPERLLPLMAGGEDLTEMMKKLEDLPNAPSDLRGGAVQKPLGLA